MKIKKFIKEHPNIEGLYNVFTLHHVRGVMFGKNSPNKYLKHSIKYTTK